MTETLKSVGIDIGTSTTQLVISELTLQNQSNPFSVPRVAITDKKIVYRSEIYFTPLLSDTVIDAKGVREIVTGEYQRAGIRRDEVQTGAVIITGETARKENAREVLTALSEFAGDFVVATAGPDLESILAARGAGVDDISKEKHISILHYDIGGGTSNLALYQNGHLRATSCLDVGGRLIKIDSATQTITYVSPKLEGRFSGVVRGAKATEALLHPLLEEMVKALLEAAGLEEPSPVLDFYTTKGTKPMKTSGVHLSFSGGIADCIFTPVNDWLAYGDIGPLLGEVIQKALAHKDVAPVQGVETIRATVVGAGAHSMDVSGSTIYYRDVAFPLKNIPVLRVDPSEERGDLASAISEKLRWYADDGGLTQIALALEGETSPSYSRVIALAEAIKSGLKPLMQKGFFPIVVIERDLAKVLGQAMAPGISGTLLCLDGVSVSNGDYIDIGAPVAGGTVLPVVVKTLAFEKK